MKLSQKPFLVLGRAGMDLYADPPGAEVEHAERFVSALGGSAANIAAGIVRLGGKASLFTTVSDDAIGRYVRNALVRYGVGVEHVSTVGGEARNSLAVVESRLENCQSIIYRNNAADFQITEAGAAKIQWADFGALIVTGTALAVEPSRAATFMAMQDAHNAEVTVIIDLDYRPYSWISAEDAAVTLRKASSLSDIVIGNDVEFAVMAGPDGDGNALARELGTKVTVYKMGERGAITYGNREVIVSGIFPVKALKPTGAGDAFMAAFVTSLTNGRDLKDAILRGSAHAAIVVTKVGCAPAMATPNELDEFMTTNKMAS